MANKENKEIKIHRTKVSAAAKEERQRDTAVRKKRRRSAAPADDKEKARCSWCDLSIQDLPAEKITFTDGKSTEFHHFFKHRQLPSISDWTTWGLLDWLETHGWTARQLPPFKQVPALKLAAPHPKGMAPIAQQAARASIPASYTTRSSTIDRLPVLASTYT